MINNNLVKCLQRPRRPPIQQSRDHATSQCIRCLEIIRTSRLVVRNNGLVQTMKELVMKGKRTCWEQKKYQAWYRTIKKKVTAKVSKSMIVQSNNNLLIRWSKTWYYSKNCWIKIGESRVYNWMISAFAGMAGCKGLVNIAVAYKEAFKLVR